MVSMPPGRPRPRPLSLARELSARRPAVSDADSGARSATPRYLEGDFVLRSGKRARTTSTSTASRRARSARARSASGIAAAVAEREPDAVRIAAPELGAVSLAAAASLAGGLPFVIVRKEAKGYGTGNRIEGDFEPGERVCLVEDVVTSGGAAVEAVEALREAGLVS